MIESFGYDYIVCAEIKVFSLEIRGQKSNRNDEVEYAEVKFMFFFYAINKFF
jgi:hypothetical protein